MVLRLGVALWRYWETRSAEQGAFALLAPALQRPDASADPGLFAAALFAAAWTGSHLPPARHFAGQAVQVARRTCRRNGNILWMAIACHGLALLAGNAGDWRRVAMLHGAAQALRDRVGGPWEQSTTRQREDSLGQARAHLGDEQLERAYAQGMALSVEQALDLALGKDGPGLMP